MQTKRLCLTLCSLLPLVGACKLLTPLIFIGEHKKKVSAEFDKLADSRVAILVWTDAATLYDYPHARFDLAVYTSSKLSAEMSQRKLGTTVVDARDVEDYLQRNVASQIDPQMVGQELKADYVVFLEILEFQIRDPNEPQFLRGKLSASVSVHDMRKDPDILSRYELSPIDSEHPEGPPILFSITRSPLVREALYRKFAEQVARKFYEHTVEM